MGKRMSKEKPDFIIPSLSFFPQSPAISMQLVLSDFLATHERGEELAYASITPGPEGDWENWLARLRHHIGLLTGNQLSTERPFSWIEVPGTLNRLRRCCHQLSQQVPEDAPLRLCQSVNSAFHRALEARRLVTMGGEEHRTSYHLRTFIAKIHQSVPLLQRCLDHFHGDENVLFFLLRHHKALDELGQGFVLKVFGRLYPKGLRSLEDFLCNTYGKRGFDHLIVPIQGLLRELESHA